MIQSRYFAPTCTNYKKPSTTTILPAIFVLALLTGLSLFSWLMRNGTNEKGLLHSSGKLSGNATETDNMAQSISSAWIPQASNGTWLCTLPVHDDDEQREDPVQARSPIIVLGDARTGSTFFFGLLRNFHRLTANRLFDLLLLYEAFNPDKIQENVLSIRLIADVIRGCHLTYLKKYSPEELERYLLHDTNLHNLEDLSLFLHRDMKTHEWDIIQPVLTAIQRRIADPFHFIRTITRIPQRSTRPYFAIKIFSFQFNSMQKTPSDFITAMNRQFVPPVVVVRGRNASREEESSENGGRGPTIHHSRFLVTYRRRMIEMLVSLVIATARGQWTNTKTTNRDMITLPREWVEDTIRQKELYFAMIRTALETNEIDYHVFEYARDLLEPESQMKTVRRLKEILHVPIEDTILTEEHFLSRNLHKQAQAPLNDLVTNWEDVIAWGYGGEVDEWEDLFPNK